MKGTVAGPQELVQKDTTEENVCLLESAVGIPKDTKVKNDVTIIAYVRGQC